MNRSTSDFLATTCSSCSVQFGIDPQISAGTRTARLRIEVPNPRNRLRFAMYADVLPGGAAGASAPMIPRSAMQNIGDRTVVYLVNPKEPGTFIEREVQLGATVGDEVTIRAGVEQSDVVVAEGSFSARAQRERLGLRAAPAVSPAQPVTTAAPAVPAHAPAGEAKVQAASVTRRELPLRTGVAIEFTPKQTGEITFACGMDMLTGSLVIR